MGCGPRDPGTFHSGGGSVGCPVPTVRRVSSGVRTRAGIPSLTGLFGVKHPLSRCVRGHDSFLPRESYRVTCFLPTDTYGNYPPSTMDQRIEERGGVISVEFYVVGSLSIQVPLLLPGISINDDLGFI